MAIEETDTIDTIGVDPDSGCVYVTVLDSHDWRRPKEHLRLWQAKFNTYIDFVKTGQLPEVDPEYAGRPVVIHLVMRFEPSPLGRRALDELARVIHGQGLGFEAEVSPDEDE